MNTIKERAYNFAEFLYGENYPAIVESACKTGYTGGANEQQEIDIQRACEWLETSINEDTLHIHQWEHECSKREFIEMFKQAMKG